MRQSQNKLNNYFWGLDPQITFLNHGSFGSSPQVVLKKQEEFKEQMVLNPVKFLDRDLMGLLLDSRQALAEFVKGAPKDLVFINNATTGVNTILASMDFKTGDEILVTDHTYNACLQAAFYQAKRKKITIKIIKLPTPVLNREAVIEKILKGVSKKTRLVLIDHITSPTAVILPVKEIVQELENKNIPVLVDGAHAPGMLDLNIRNLGCSFYTGNCHKWMCAPKGAAFLYARKDWQDKIFPLSISHGYGIHKSKNRFHALFDWTGTDDPTAYLCVKTAIETLSKIRTGGWPAVQEHNISLAKKAGALIISELGFQPTCPENMIGSMASFVLPEKKGVFDECARDPLAKVLYDRYKIEIPVMFWPAHNKRYLRLSAQVYNTFEQYEYLVRALKKSGL